jgi:thiaminase/transcriptional activator TenA
VTSSAYGDPPFRADDGATSADQLITSVEEYWPRVSRHLLCREAAAGTLEEDAFERWMIADYTFNVQYRRFLAGLLTIAPSATTAEVVSLGLPAINDDTSLIVATARHHGVDLERGAGPTTISFVSYLQAVLAQGYATALSAFFMSQKIYFVGWSAVRQTADRDSRYWPFVDSWSSAPYATFVSSLARLVNSAAPLGPTDSMLLATSRVMRFELSFWDSIYGGETW